MQRATAGERRLDRFAAAAGAWAVGGAWLDAWSHHATQVELFFTPAHGVLYAGLLATAAVLLAGSAIARHGWRLAIRPPPGYGPALIGIPVFVAGGVGDYLWHTLLGIEEGLDALLSPTHLVLGAGGGLMASGPLLAAWHRARGAADGGGHDFGLPATISIGLVVSLVAFFTTFANPIALPLAAGDAAPRLGDVGVEAGRMSAAIDVLGQALGLASILILAASAAAAVLAVVLRWDVPFGSLALVFAIGIGTSAVPHQTFAFVPVAVVAGLAADGLARRLRPRLDRPAALALFAFLVPAVFSALYFAAIAATVGIAWPVELWTGSIVLAGGIGIALAVVTLAASAAMVGSVLVGDAGDVPGSAMAVSGRSAASASSTAAAMCPVGSGGSTVHHRATQESNCSCSRCSEDTIAAA